MRVTDAPLPRPAPTLTALADQCVQCGLCLPACPTYALEPLETQSPRGRIALAKAWETGLAAPTAVGDRHLDQCLGCRRCETVCPAGVRYGEILTLARSRQRERRPVNRRQRFAEALTAHPRRLRALLALYRQAYPLLPQAWRPLPRPPRMPGPLEAGAGPAPATAPLALADAPTPTNEARTLGAAIGIDVPTSLGLFLGCVAPAYEQALHHAVAKLCAVTGATVESPIAQTCCGSLHAHAGDLAQAERLAARNRSAFAAGATVLTLASGCHAQVETSLRGHAQAVDAIAWLAQRADALRFVPRPERIALHLPCTQRNSVKSDDALRGLLARVPALEVVALDAGFGCCGAAGTQMLSAPARAARFRQPLLEQLAASGANRLLSANIGCRLHLANGTALPVQHPLEFLAECLA